MDLMTTAQLLGNFGEFLGAIAVVVTLIFLTLQIRQNTKSLDESRTIALAQTYQSRAALIMDALEHFDDAEFSSIYLKYQAERSARGAQAAIASLAPSERWRLNTYLNVMRTYADNNFYHHQLGLLDAEYAAWGLGPTGALGQHAQDWKDWNIPMGRESFRQEVERYLSQANTTE